LVSNRHNTVQQALAEELRFAGAHVLLEPPTGVDELRLDLAVTVGSHRWALDVSIVNPAAPSYTRVHGSVLGEACKAAARDKIAKHSEGARRLGCELVPFVLDCYGHFSPQAKKFTKDVARRLAEVHGQDFYKTHARLVNAVSVAVQRGNAACLHTAAAFCYNSAAGVHNGGPVADFNAGGGGLR